MTNVLDALANIFQFVVPALLIAWADRPPKGSERSIDGTKPGDA
jgi:hypothetical protein